MKPDVIYSLNKISSSLYDEPPIEAAKPLLRGVSLNNTFLVVVVVVIVLIHEHCYIGANNNYNN